MRKLLSVEEATIWNHLEKGSENGKTSSVLTKETGFNRRKICEAVEGLRLKGYPVGALRRNRTGYFRIVNRDEQNETVRQLRRQAEREFTLANQLASMEIEQENEHE